MSLCGCRLPGRLAPRGHAVVGGVAGLGACRVFPSPARLFTSGTASLNGALRTAGLRPVLLARMRPGIRRAAAGLGAPRLGVSRLLALGSAVAWLSIALVGVTRLGIPRLGAPSSGFPRFGAAGAGVTRLAIALAGITRLGIPRLGAPSPGFPRFGAAGACVAWLTIALAGVARLAGPWLGVPPPGGSRLAVVWARVPGHCVARLAGTRLGRPTVGRRCLADHLDGLTNQPFDGAEVAAFAGVAERHSSAFGPGPSGSADPVHIVFGFHRQFVIDHMGDAADVDSARGNVGGHQHAGRAGTEAAQRPLSRGLGLVAVGSLRRRRRRRPVPRRPGWPCAWCG